MRAASLAIALMIVHVLACADGQAWADGQTRLSGGRLAVHFSVDQAADLAEEDLQVAIDQVRQIWRSAGVDVTHGRHGVPSTGAEMTVSLRILTTPVAKIDQRMILGWVTPEAVRGSTLVLFVSLKAVRELSLQADFRGRPLNQRPRLLRDRLIAQAVGRVVAHELGHYLLQRPAHGDGGLLRAHYSARDLIAPSIEPFKLTKPDSQLLSQVVGRFALLMESGSR